MTDSSGYRIVQFQKLILSLSLRLTLTHLQFYENLDSSPPSLRLLIRVRRVRND
jgi:hypothetical protein